MTTTYIRPKRSAWWHRVRPDAWNHAAASILLTFQSDIPGGTKIVYGDLVAACGVRVGNNGAELRKRRPTRGRVCGRCG